MSGRVDYGFTPANIVRAFDCKASLSMAETALLLGMDEKTLRGHIDSGYMGYYNFGLGKRRRIQIGIIHINQFLEAQSRNYEPVIEHVYETVTETVYLEKKWRYNQPKISAVGSHVYFIRSGKYVKIGTAINVSKRMSTLQIAHPEELELLLCVPGGGVEEAAFHLRFKAYRVRGEWFSLTPEILDWIAQERHNASASEEK